MKNNISHLVNTRYPIIQAPMLGVTTPAMVAAVAASGGLGSLPVGGLSPERTRTLIRDTRSRTGKPYSVNLFAHKLVRDIDEEQIARMEDFLEQIHRRYHLPFERKAIADYRFYNHLDQIDILLEEQVPVVSFTFGCPEPDVLEQLNKAGIIVMGTATSVREAILLQEAGVDAIIAQGIEAGGHRGSFIEDEPLPQVGLISLLPQIVDTITLPVIAAGGLFDHRTIKAAFTLGASAVQLGSYFIAADESAAGEAYKERLLASTDTSTELTRAFSGRWARGIKNGFMQEMEDSGLAVPYYTFQNSLTAALRDYGKANDIGDILSLWSGQAGSRSERGSTAYLFGKLIDQLYNH